MPSSSKLVKVQGMGVKKLNGNVLISVISEN